MTFKFLRDKSLNKKYIAEKDGSEILRWPYVTFNDPEDIIYIVK